jgi:plastocyanin
VGIGRPRATARPALLVPLVVLVVLVLTTCGGSSPSANAGPPPPGTAVTVDIRNVAFNPQSVSVHAGQTVAWKFDDGSIAHNVTGFDWSSPDRTSGYYTHTFATPGTYAFRCTIHSNMVGQVVVTP